MEWQKAQISSHWTRRQVSPRSFSSWYSEHACPSSTNSLVTVLLAAPVMRTVARMLLPSTTSMEAEITLRLQSKRALDANRAEA